MSKLVTKDSLIKMLEHPNRKYVIQVVGRALVTLYNNQTESEKRSNDTREHNMVGFTGADGHSGCITAKYFLRHKTLTDWQIEMWTKRNKQGVPRIAKYHAQLDAAAQHRKHTQLDLNP